MPKVLLNIDLGEIDGEPEELYALATAVNIACGGHAGDEASMDRAARLAMKAGARIAAHPSYPDRDGFGRRRVAIGAGDLEESVRAQCEALRRAVSRAGGEICAIKPHGALYHEAARDAVVAKAVIAGALRGLLSNSIEVVGSPGGALLSEARALGLPALREGFADRGYREDGSLVPRGEAGALLEDPDACAAQAVRLARSGDYETLCLHADTKGALSNARVVRRALTAEGLLAISSGDQAEPVSEGR
jgi:5-oxoprolinase (ATP-hydrolysing) subunit A